jgi:hypothetical protein
MPEYGLLLLVPCFLFLPHLFCVGWAHVRGFGGAVGCHLSCCSRGGDGWRGRGRLLPDQTNCCGMDQLDPGYSSQMGAVTAQDKYESNQVNQDAEEHRANDADELAEARCEERVSARLLLWRLARGMVTPTTGWRHHSLRRPVGRSARRGMRVLVLYLYHGRRRSGQAGWRHLRVPDGDASGRKAGWSDEVGPVPGGHRLGGARAVLRRGPPCVPPGCRDWLRTGGGGTGGGCLGELLVLAVRLGTSPYGVRSRIGGRGARRVAGGAGGCWARCARTI